MTTEREAFENWAKTQGMGTVKNPNGIYVEFDPRQAWLAWQASRKVALKEVVDICRVVALPGVTEYADGYNTGAWECEQRIKELK